MQKKKYIYKNRNCIKKYLKYKKISTRYLIIVKELKGFCLINNIVIFKLKYIYCVNYKLVYKEKLYTNCIQ